VTRGVSVLAALAAWAAFVHPDPAVHAAGTALLAAALASATVYVWRHEQARP
jgi:hypothetical protein